MDAREFFEAHQPFDTPYSYAEAYAAAKVEEIAGGLAGALEEYGWHGANCGLSKRRPPTQDGCTCGLSAALAAYHEAVGR